MPELPEVETITRALAPRLVGRRILAVQVFAPRLLRGATLPDLAGARIAGVERHGKFIVIALDRGVLAIHLGMTGKLLFDADRSPYLRAEILLEDATLLYDDVRQFGRILWCATLPPNIARLGPEPLEIDAASFYLRLHARRSRIKPLLLNQTFVRGMGNIYTDEALFRAGVHPRAWTMRLSRAKAATLHQAMQQVLMESIDSGGSSISDYVDTAGRRGSFQELHLVYGREGQACARCGEPIRKIVVAQRGTHFCPRCQKL